MNTSTRQRIHRHAIELRERSQSVLYHSADWLENKLVTDDDCKLMRLRLDAIEHEVKAMRNLIGDRK